MSTKFKINGNKNIEHDSIKAKIGLTNKKNHTVFYVEGGTFIKPMLEYDNFSDIMYNIEKKCRQHIKQELLYSTFLSTNFLFNFDICSDRMHKNKNTYLSFQYHFKQKDNQNVSVVTLKEENSYFFTNLLNDMEKILSEYNMEISKKKV